MKTPSRLVGRDKNLGMTQRACGIVITRAPMLLHRKTGKLVVFGVTFVVTRPIDQVDDVVDLLLGLIAEQPRFRAVPQIRR